MKTKEVKILPSKTQLNKGAKALIGLMPWAHMNKNQRLAVAAGMYRAMVGNAVVVQEPPKNQLRFVKETSLGVQAGGPSLRIVGVPGFENVVLHQNNGDEQAYRTYADAKPNASDMHPGGALKGAWFDGLRHGRATGNTNALYGKIGGTFFNAANVVPVPPEQTFLGTSKSWRVGLFDSSSRPGTKVLMLAQDKEVEEYPQRKDFHGWVSPSAGARESIRNETIDEVANVFVVRAGEYYDLGLYQKQGKLLREADRVRDMKRNKPVAATPTTVGNTGSQVESEAQMIQGQIKLLEDRFKNVTFEQGKNNELALNLARQITNLKAKLNPLTLVTVTCGFCLSPHKIVKNSNASTFCSEYCKEAFGKRSEI